MSEQTTKNFWTVIESFPWPDPKPLSYRLYHDDQGRPLFYTMEAVPGTYIEVDQITYIQGSYQVRVREGRLIQLEPRINVSRLVPDPDSGIPCDPRDVCVVVDSSRPHQKWKMTTNDND